MLKHCLKSPFLCLFWSLPLLAALGFDIYIWQTGGIGFHFSETGYLLQHYMPDAYHEIVNAVDDPLYRIFLDNLFHMKTALLGAIIAAIPILIINRPRREIAPSPARHIRR